MKIISWNVNGIRSVLNKGFLEFVQREKPDILCLQEVRSHHHDLPLSQHPYQFWNAAEKKGYAGTAVFSQIKPLDVVRGGFLEEGRKEGRMVTLEFADFFLVNVYAPNSRRGLVRLSFRDEWDQQFLGYLKSLEAKKPVLFCGDLNVAHRRIDLANPRENYNRTAGYTQVEIDGFQNLLDAGFVDTFREFDQSPGKYTWWSYLFNARTKNIGWRIDYVCISRKLQPRLKDSFILSQVLGSDHCPVGIVLE